MSSATTTLVTWPATARARSSESTAGGENAKQCTGRRSAASLPPPPPPVARTPTCPPIAQPAGVQAAAEAAEAAIGVAACPAKAAVFVLRDGLSGAMLDEGVLVGAQLAAAGEARVRLSGKTPARRYASVHAADEAALERTLIQLLLLMSKRSTEVEVEVRWLLRAPAVPAAQLLARWQAAVDASQARFPIERVHVQLQADESCIKLALHSDGYEEWDDEAEANGHRAAERAPVPLLVAFCLMHVRYAGAVQVYWYPLTPSQEAYLLERPLRLRALSAQAGCVAFLAPARPHEKTTTASQPPIAGLDLFGPNAAGGGDDDDAGDPTGSLAGARRARRPLLGPRLCLCGPRPALKRARALLETWEVAVVLGTTAKAD